MRVNNEPFTITGRKNYNTGRANPRRVNRTIRQNNRNGVRNNLVARPGEYVNARTGQPYTGPIHMHDGTAMIGATHSSTPHDYLRRTGRNRRRMINDNGNGNLYNYGHVECDCAGSGGLISIDTTSQTHHNHVSRICRGDCGYANETVYGGGGTGNEYVVGKNSPYISIPPDGGNNLMWVITCCGNSPVSGNDSGEGSLYHRTMVDCSNQCGSAIIEV